MGVSVTHACVSVKSVSPSVLHPQAVARGSWAPDELRGLEGRGCVIPSADLSICFLVPQKPACSSAEEGVRSPRAQGLSLTWLGEARLALATLPK